MPWSNVEYELVGVSSHQPLLFARQVVSTELLQTTILLIGPLCYTIAVYHMSCCKDTYLASTYDRLLVRSAPC